jgi:hypothetical protein
MGFDLEANDSVKVPEPRKFTTLYIKKSLKLQLDDLKLHRDTYMDVIQRLIDKRSFDIVNGQIVPLDDKLFVDEVRSVIEKWMCQCPEEKSGVDTAKEKEILSNKLGVDVDGI